MKKILYWLVVFLASLLIISCGGGSDTSIKSGGDVSSKSLEYKGAVGKGDYAQVKFDPKSGKLDFNISGQFADTVGVHEGTINLNHVYGNIYTKEDNNSSVGLFVSNSTALALVELTGSNNQNQQFFFGMLENHGTNPTYDDVNGTYNIIIALNNVRKQKLCKITFNSSDKTGAIGPCSDDDSDDETNIPFTWDINSSTKLIEMSSESPSYKAIAVFKKNSKRDAIVIDIQQTPNNKSGMAIGLRAKALEANEMASGAEFKYIDLNSDTSINKTYAEYGKVKLTYTSQSPIIKMEDSNFNLSTKGYDSPETGYVLVNPQDDEGRDWIGAVRICEDENCQSFTQEYAIFSAEDGYYFSVNTEDDSNSDEDDFILSLGSNRPVQ